MPVLIRLGGSLKKNYGKLIVASSLTYSREPLRTALIMFGHVIDNVLGEVCIDDRLLYLCLGVIKR